MGFKNKLASLTQLRRPSRGAPVTPVERRVESIPGVARPTAFGSARVIRTEQRLGECWEELPIQSVPESSWRTLASLGCSTELTAIAEANPLFIDTETTGLAGGAGTIPFLIGVAWFESDRLVVEQYFVEGFGRESPALAALSERIAEASMLVSFNGKSFDWPLIKSRFVMNRLPVPPTPLHFDLLHAARRVLKRRLSSCRLTALESSLFGFRRVGDVDGAQIPELYFRFIETGQFGQLSQVLTHNVLDLLSMPAILRWLIEAYQTVSSSGHPEDWVSIALLAERHGEHHRAELFARAVLDSHGAGPAIRADAHLLLARLAYRAGRSEKEVSELLAVIELPPGRWRHEAHFRLAIAYEHRLRDLPRALEHAKNTQTFEGASASEHRCERLRRRLMSHRRSA